MDIQLSRNFRLSEFFTTDFPELQDIPSVQVLDNIKSLTGSILQPLRDYLGVPIKIHSGYRSASLNKKVGGSQTSDHLTGRAVDISVPGVNELELIKAIRDLNLPFDQLIASGKGWIHISRRFWNRNEVLLKTGSGYQKTSFDKLIV